MISSSDGNTIIFSLLLNLSFLFSPEGPWPPGCSSPCCVTRSWNQRLRDLCLTVRSVHLFETHSGWFDKMSVCNRRVCVSASGLTRWLPGRRLLSALWNAAFGSRGEKVTTHFWMLKVWIFSSHFSLCCRRVDLHLLTTSCLLVGSSESCSLILTWYSSPQKLRSSDEISASAFLFAVIVISCILTHTSCLDFPPPCSWPSSVTRLSMWSWSCQSCRSPTWVRSSPSCSSSAVASCWRVCSTTVNWLSTCDHISGRSSGSCFALGDT